MWAAAGWPVSRARLERAGKSVTSGWDDRSAVIGLSERTLFDALLSELALPAGDKIVMSGVNIQNMLDIARAHGLEIVPVDIDPATLAPAPGALLTAQAKSGARLCVVAQLYGSVSRIHDAVELRTRGVFVLEDAAQAFAGQFHRGDTEADASLFSFGPIKRRTALGGGVGVFRDKDLAARIERRLASHEPRSDRWLRKRALKYLLLKTLSTPRLYGALLRMIRIAGKDPDKVIGESARGFSGPSLIESIRSRPPARMVALMARQMETTDDGASRQAICRDFLSLLPHAFTGLGRSADRHAYWLLAIRCSRSEDVLKFLRSRGFDATRGTTSLRALVPEETPDAARLIETVVYLPHPAGLPDRTRKKLAAALSDFAALDAGNRGQTPPGLETATVRI